MIPPEVPPPAAPPLWVKICGNTSLADSRLALRYGADALGFIFAPSPRQVTIDQVSQITAYLPTQAETIGVFVHPTYEQVTDAVNACGLSGVQLHAGGIGFPARLRDHFGPTLRILRVIHFGPDALADLQAASSEPGISAVLIDSRVGATLGGTGIPFDWALARSTIFTPTSPLRLIAAGGLNPSNVAEAVRTLQPWGIDAVSGVESSPGIKDPQKLRDFIAAARAAALL